MQENSAQISDFIEKKDKILKQAHEFFKNSNSHQIKIGCELEFFLWQKSSQDPAENEVIEEFLLLANKKLAENFSLFLLLEKERGIAQIELKTSFTDQILELATQLEKMKEMLKFLAESLELDLILSSQPKISDCGSACQLNISLHNLDGENLFSLQKDLLILNAKKLLNYTDEIMYLLAPQSEDYLRFDVDLNKNLFRQGKFTAPTNLSFGTNNRTCAIRFAKGESGTRLEYRVAGSNCSIFLVLAAILLILSEENFQPKKWLDDEKLTEVFGNAFDDIFVQNHSLKKFAAVDLASSEKLFFSEENFVRRFFQYGLTVRHP